jgi:hypothetical protein
MQGQGPGERVTTCAAAVPAGTACAAGEPFNGGKEKRSCNGKGAGASGRVQRPEIRAFVPGAA